MHSRKKPIVIVGSGFAGINAAFTLKRLNPTIAILVIDSQSKFIFKPLLYEVLSDEMQEWEAATEFEEIFANSGITFLNNNLLSVDLDERSLTFQNNLILHYEYLVISTGSKNNTFSIGGVDKYCHFFNNLNDLKNLKMGLAKSLNKSGMKNLSIIGAGPSGVELACKLFDMYPNVFKISVIERSKEVLNQSKTFNREEAEKAIKDRNIKVLLNTSVEEIHENQILLKDKYNHDIQWDYDLVIWAAGIKPTLPIFEQEVQKINQKIATNVKLQLKSYENVFVIGDISVIKGFEILPSTAQNAMQQGIHVGVNLNLLLNGKELLDYQFIDNGEMISLGIGKASLSGLGLTLSGKFAFELRRLIYASKMPIFQNSFKSAAAWLINKKNIFNNTN